MRLKIVYIDDELGLCQTFDDNFGASSDIEIQTFVDPEVALNSIEVNHPDLVFLDYRFPNTTGVDVGIRIKPQIPVALITGDLSIKLQAPFVKIFPKPFDFAEMAIFIQTYLDKKRIA